MAFPSAALPAPEEGALELVTLGGADHLLWLWSKLGAVARKRPLTLWVPPEPEPLTQAVGRMLGAEVRYLETDLSEWVLSRPGDPELPETGRTSCHVRQHLQLGLPLSDWYPELPLVPPLPPAPRSRSAPHVLAVLGGLAPTLEEEPTQHHRWFNLLDYLERHVAPARLLIDGDSLDVAGILLSLLEQEGSRSRRAEHLWEPEFLPLLAAIRTARLVVGPVGPVTVLAAHLGIPTLLLYPDAHARMCGTWEPRGPVLGTTLSQAVPRLYRGELTRRLGLPGPVETAREPAVPAARQNPWGEPVDWPPPAEPVPDRGGILAIIPTAGREPDVLRRCLESLHRAAGPEPVHPVVVVCPGTEKALRNAWKAADGRAEVLGLPGPFNFCRSIHAGLRQRRPGDGYALFLNDDVRFTRDGDLKQLKDVLRWAGWAQTGPWFRGRKKWEKEEDRIDDIRGQKRPLVGGCVLWDLVWLDRLTPAGAPGPLDEEFGIGYGCDEADLSLRALRRGAVWGRDERVIVEHDWHRSFGDDYVDFESEAHQRNVRYFRQKYGADVGLWGESHHWEPLPGLHVALAGHNVCQFLDRCLDSVERALEGFRYVVTYADDGSTDWSADIAREWQARSRADRFLIETFPKGRAAGEAKNRSLRMGQPYARRYPAVVLMDADDVMPEERVRHLFWRARDGGHLLVHGSHQLIAPFNPSVHGRIYGPAPEYQQYQGWIHPCATLFHHSLVPEDGRLFDETLPICEDAHRFLLWYLSGLRSVPLPGPVCHHYIRRDGSVMQSAGAEARQQEYDALRRELLRAFIRGESPRENG